MAHIGVAVFNCERCNWPLFGYFVRPDAISDDEINAEGFDLVCNCCGWQGHRHGIHAVERITVPWNLKIDLSRHKKNT